MISALTGEHILLLATRCNMSFSRAKARTASMRPKPRGLGRRLQALLCSTLTTLWLRYFQPRSATICCETCGGLELLSPALFALTCWRPLRARTAPACSPPHKPTGHSPRSHRGPSACTSQCTWRFDSKHWIPAVPDDSSACISQWPDDLPRSFCEQPIIATDWSQFSKLRGN
jgi:hypothetical protein